MSSGPTSVNLIAVLHRGEPESQALLKNWCRQPIGRLVEQPDNDPHQSPLEASLARLAAAHLAAGRALHDTIPAVLEEAPQASPQRDDITVLTIRHRQAAPAEREAAHVPM